MSRSRPLGKKMHKGGAKNQRECSDPCCVLIIDPSSLLFIGQPFPTLVFGHSNFRDGFPPVVDGVVVALGVDIGPEEQLGVPEEALARGDVVDLQTG